MNDPFIILCIAAVYFFIGLVMQFAIFDKYERGEEDISENEIVCMQIAIWSWPIVLVGTIIMFVLFTVYWMAMIPVYYIQEKISRR